MFKGVQVAIDVSQVSETNKLSPMLAAHQTFANMHFILVSLRTGTYFNGFDQHGVDPLQITQEQLRCDACSLEVFAVMVASRLP